MESHTSNIRGNTKQIPTKYEESSGKKGAKDITWLAGYIPNIKVSVRQKIKKLDNIHRDA